MNVPTGGGVVPGQQLFDNQSPPALFLDAGARQLFGPDGVTPLIDLNLTATGYVDFPQGLSAGGGGIDTSNGGGIDTSNGGFIDTSNSDGIDTSYSGGIDTSNSGGIDTSGGGGYIRTSGGGFIDTSGGSGFIRTSGGSGSIDTSNVGGYIDTSSGGGGIRTSYSGGYIDTGNGGGYIDTSNGGAGLITNGYNAVLNWLFAFDGVNMIPTDPATLSVGNVTDTSAVPAASGPGNPGQMIFTDDAIYRCFASGDWRKVSMPYLAY